MELPRLEPLWQKYRDKGLSIVAVEATRDRERALKFIDKHNLTYHLLEAEEEKRVVKEKFGIKWFPTSFLIDRERRIMICHVGFRAGDEVKLEQEILRLSTN
ncbi:MAG: redoxin domain-containing protein [Candidatus Latescibacteria bacterium]|nr:redoxin domain-containing protein [Candidatus Latescibacterota bacterium]NIO57436.1 redoxin domain-containing protein [Candidatus Latescibacterota bacterium]